MDAGGGVKSSEREQEMEMNFGKDRRGARARDQGRRVRNYPTFERALMTMAINMLSNMTVVNKVNVTTKKGPR